MCNFLNRGCGNIAEEKVGDVALKNDDLAVARQDAGKHADGALQNGNYGKHGSNAESYAGDTDERPDAMPTKIGENQLEKDHGRAPVVISEAL